MSQPKFTSSSLKAAHAVWNTKQGWDTVEQLAEQIDSEAGVYEMAEVLRVILETGALHAWANEKGIGMESYNNRGRLVDSAMEAFAKSEGKR